MADETSHTSQPEQPIKFRLRRQPRPKTICIDEEGDCLDAVLKKERSAWGSGCIDKETIFEASSDDGEDGYDDASDVTPKACSYKDCDDRLQCMISEGPRRSFFQEGSMNEASRATASTWNQSSVSSLLSTEGHSVPPSPAMSLSSSFDINDLKPLPMTPSTLMSTVKKIGEKIKGRQVNAASNTLPTLPDSVLASTSSRKPVATWKLFLDRSANDTAFKSDDVATHEDESAKSHLKSSHRLLGLVNRPFSPKTARDEVSVVDDRKRKAEAAYAEHFATYKKHKMQVNMSRGGDSITSSDFMPTESGGDTTSQATLKAYRRQSAPVQELRKAFIMEEVGCLSDHEKPSLRPKIASLPVPSRTSSSKLLSKNTSDNERTKRVSRSELEKENRKLRALLRETQRQTERCNRADSDECYPGRSSKTRPTTRRRSAQELTTSRKFEVHEDSPTKSGQLLRCHLSLQEMNSVSASLLAAAQYRSNHSPVSHKPTRSAREKTLAPVNANQLKAQERNTVRRYASSRPSPSKIEMPRALSMVLEGIENESSEDDTECESEMTSSRKRNSSYEVSSGQNFQTTEVLQKLVPVGANEASQSWQWPEDVF